MPNSNQADQLLQDLVGLLDVYGSDRNRWPAADRLRLSAFVASNAYAKQALAEAAALDRLLDMAPSVGPNRARALAQRIVATAAGNLDTPSDPPAGNVVALSSARKPHQPFLRRHTRQAAAALLAASLVLGLFAGTSRQFSSAVDFVADAVGLSDDEPELAFVNGAATPGEEAL